MKLLASAFTQIPAQRAYMLYLSKFCQKRANIARLDSSNAFISLRRSATQRALGIYISSVGSFDGATLTFILNLSYIRQFCIDAEVDRFYQPRKEHRDECR